MSKNKTELDVYSIKLAVNQMPKLSVDISRDIVKYGPKNDFPGYLMFLADNHPLHGGIINGKARYISGKCIKPKNESVNAQLFLDNANPSESMHQVLKKTNIDEVTCGGFFLKVITNAFGQPVQYYHLVWAKCRISPCENFVRYSEDWNHIYLYPIVDIPIWREGFVGTSVIVYKTYSPSKTLIEGVYAKPEYRGAINDIDTDIRIGTYGNALVRNNFSAGHIVTIYNGETDKEKKKQIAEDLKFNHEGEEVAGSTVTIFASKDAKSTEVATVNQTDQDKQYVEVNKRDQQNILTAHGVNGILFKIRPEGQGLNTRSELVEAHEQFINEYVTLKQEPILELLKKLFKLRYFEENEFEIEQVQPIGLELPLDNQNVFNALNAKDPNIIIDYLVQKYGIKLPETLDATGNVITEAAVSVNDNMKGLSAAENADVLRIVRDFQKGRSGMSEAMAISRISSYGVSEAEARKWLGLGVPVQQSSQDKSIKFFELFNKYAHEINFEDEIIDTRQVQFCSMQEAIKFERVRFKDYISDPLKVSVTDLNNAILNELKGNPTLTPDQLSKILKIEVGQAEDSLKSLKDAGLITGESGTFTPTEKGINKTTDNVETEVYTEYVYAKRADVSGETVMPTTRQFCKDLVSQTKQKALRFEAIMQLENDFGENVWDFRGGFYTKPGTNETTPWCRHVWQAVTKVRRTKK